MIFKCWWSTIPGLRIPFAKLPINTDRCGFRSMVGIGSQTGIYLYVTTIYIYSVLLKDKDRFSLRIQDINIIHKSDY